MKVTCNKIIKYFIFDIQVWQKHTSQILADVRRGRSTYQLRICLSPGPGHSSQTQHSTKAKVCICPLQIHAFLETGTPLSYGSPFQCKNVYQCRYTFLAWLMLMKWFRCVVWSCENSLRERKFGKCADTINCQLLCRKRRNFGSCGI